MGRSTITDMAELRLPAKVLHAWAEGDNAAQEGMPHDNPYPKNEPALRDAWGAGYTCTPLPGWTLGHARHATDPVKRVA